MSKISLVTGTSTGFGKLMTITLATEGHTIVAGMRGITGKNAAVARELAALPNVDVVELDVTRTGGSAGPGSAGFIVSGTGMAYYRFRRLVYLRIFSIPHPQKPGPDHYSSLQVD